MPKLDLRNAAALKNSNGEITALKAEGIAWVRPAGDVAPYNITPPTISPQSPMVGDTITGTAGTWGGVPEPIVQAVVQVQKDGGTPFNVGAPPLVVSGTYAGYRLRMYGLAYTPEGAFDQEFSEWTDYVPAATSVAPTPQSAPTISPDTGPVGTVFTITEGTYGGTMPITITGTLAQAGVDVTADMSGSTFTSTAAGPLVWTETASNGTQPDAEQTASAMVEEIVSPMSFPAQGAKFDMDFAGQRYHNGIQPKDGNVDDERFFRQSISQSAPILYEEADGSLYRHASGNGLRVSTRGLIVHSYVNYSYILQNRDLAQAVWTKAGCTASKTLVSRDKTANSASLVTVQEAGATILQTITSAGLRRPWLDVKRIAGTGNISMTFDGGATWEVLDLSDIRFDGWARCSLPMRNIANDATVGFQFEKAGDQFGIDLIQLSDRDYEASPIQVVATAARKLADRPTAGASTTTAGGYKSGLVDFYRGTDLWGVYMEFQIHDPGNLLGQITRFDPERTFSFRTSYSGASLVADASATRPWPKVNRILGMTDGKGGARFCVNGGRILRASEGFGRFVTLDHTDLMSNGAASANGDGVVRRMAFFETPMTDAEMQLWTSL